MRSGHGRALIIAAALVAGCLAVLTLRICVSRSDPLLGRWVMLAGNGGSKNPPGTLDFRADGTAVMSIDGQTVTTRYKREPGAEWVKRRTAGLGLPGGDSALAEYKKPGVEMIEFADSSGNFADFGSTLLTLDPERRVLYNLLTQLWCRPGDEERVKGDFKGPSRRQG